MTGGPGKTSTDRTRVGAGCRRKRDAPPLLHNPSPSPGSPATPSFVLEASLVFRPTPKRPALRALARNVAYNLTSGLSLCRLRLSTLLALSPLPRLGTALRVLTADLPLVCTRPLSSALCKDPGPSVSFFRLSCRSSRLCAAPTNPPAPLGNHEWPILWWINGTWP